MKKYEKPSIRMVKIQQTHMICTSPKPQGGDGGDNPSRSFSIDGEE